MSLVSIIIPNYNCAKWLSATLDSCLVDTSVVKEIIVVDDFSTDDSIDVLNRYKNQFPGIIKVFRNAIKGGNNARNFGYEQSTGEFIQWLDADDQISQDKLRTQLNAFVRNDELSIVYSDWQLNTYDQSGNLVRKELKCNRPYDDYLLELLRNNWSAPNVYLLRRSIAHRLSAVKAWNPATEVGQDREYFTLAAIAGARFGYVPGNFATYNRWNKSSVSAAKLSIRQANTDRMLNRFNASLLDAKLDPQALTTYRQLIFTEKLQLIAAGFSASMPEDMGSQGRVRWEMVSGLRTRLKVWLAHRRLRNRLTKP